LETIKNEENIMLKKIFKEKKRDKEGKQRKTKEHY